MASPFKHVCYQFDGLLIKTRFSFDQLGALKKIGRSKSNFPFVSVRNFDCSDCRVNPGSFCCCSKTLKSKCVLIAPVIAQP